MSLPSYLKSGDAARLFPVLATTSKEGRTTAIFLACLSRVDEFGRSLIGSIGESTGKRSSIETYTEIVFTGEKDSNTEDRPDGLIILQNGKREWRALVEAKVGTAQIGAEQVEKYRSLARAHGVDCVITISNQFATNPTSHPVEDIRKSRSKIPVFHWSWMFILTSADLLLSNDGVAGSDQKYLLNEFKRFLTHESAGVKGFDRMPPEWTELNKLVSAGGQISPKSELAHAVLEAWHQETKDLSLILTRKTEVGVTEKLSRKHQSDVSERRKDELHHLATAAVLQCTLDIPHAAAPLEVIADITRRCVDIGMSLRAPEVRKSSKARLNWLLRQIRLEDGNEIFIRCQWPGKSPDTQFSLTELKNEPGIIEEGKEHLQVVGFHVFLSRRLGARFTQQVNFVKDLEDAVPEFYEAVGQNLSAWVKKAPKIKQDEVDMAALSEEAEADARSTD